MKDSDSKFVELGVQQFTSCFVKVVNYVLNFKDGFILQTLVEFKCVAFFLSVR